MATFSAILAALGAIPSMIGAFKDLIAWLEQTFGPDWAGRIEDLRVASEKWRKAMTTQERNDAARAMALAFNSSK